MTVKTAEDISNEVKSKSWNECIVPRLEPMRAWFFQNEWTEGLRPYLMHIEKKFIQRMVAGDSTLTHEQNRFIAGQVAMLQEILALPDVILENIIKMDRNKAAAKKQADSVGSAGY